MICTFLALRLHFTAPGCPVRHYLPTPQPRVCKAGPCLNDHPQRRRR